VNRYLRLVWLCLGLGAFVFLAVLFVLPSRWEVVRRREVAAPPERVFAQLEDLHAWNAWSPWREDAYPGLVFKYAGPPRGAGAEVSWDSKATGDGALRIVESESPRRLAFTMTFQRGRIRARDTLVLEPLAGGRTRVTWTDRGTLGRTLLGRLSLPVVEQSMGRDLERGLAALAAVSEKGGGAVNAEPAAMASDVPAASSKGLR
jgi:uncharacterized protein YndB with AHSA1/START domain